MFESEARSVYIYIHVYAWSVLGVCMCVCWKCARSVHVCLLGVCLECVCVSAWSVLVVCMCVWLECARSVYLCMLGVCMCPDSNAIPIPSLALLEHSTHTPMLCTAVYYPETRCLPGAGCTGCSAPCSVYIDIYIHTAK